MRLIGPLPAVVAVILIVCAGVGGVRWARQHSTGAQMMASAMLLVLGLTVPVVEPPQQRIEEARQDKDKTGKRNNKNETSDADALPDEPGGAA